MQLRRHHVPRPTIAPRSTSTKPRSSGARSPEVRPGQDPAVGEMLRAAVKLRDPWLREGNGYWDKDYEHFVAYLRQHLTSEDFFTNDQKRQVTEDPRRHRPPRVRRGIRGALRSTDRPGRRMDPRPLEADPARRDPRPRALSRLRSACSPGDQRRRFVEKRYIDTFHQLRRGPAFAPAAEPLSRPHVGTRCA
jgi:hypothetical protein